MRISRFAGNLGVSRIVSVLGILSLCCLGELTAALETGGSTSLITTAERQVLIALYTSTNGDSWTDKTGWKAPPLDPDGFALPGTEAGWYGLTVDSGSLQVTRINMPSNNLTGSLPMELGNLTGLTWLYLDNNQIGGSIPASLGNLTALQELHLYHNQLTGSIPAEIGNLANLDFLDLGNNQLTGSIPTEIGKLNSMVKLCLNDNQLSGSIPAELGSLSNLGYIYLNTNQLSGSIPAELGRLLNLRQLFLYSNELSGSIPPELGNVINLQWIVLRYNQLSGEIPAELGNLTNLLVLRLGDNQLSGEIPAELGNLANLQSLRLAHNQLSGEIPDTLGNLTQLWEMLINSNQLTGLVPTSLANLTALTTTDFGYNALYTSDEALITFLSTKDPDWAATQTIAPAQVTATSLDNAVIMVSWLPVTYTADAGYYKVLISETLGGSYTLAGQTTDKTTAAVNVTGLTPGTRYYFVVRTVTNAHANNQNIVESENSSEATAIAWLQTQVQISGTVLVGGSPLSGVVLSGLPDGTVTDALGAYSAAVAVDFSGTVTPVLAGYTFDPLSQSYTNVMTNQTLQDYAATPIVVLAITVTSPNGGERWSVGSSHGITWTQTGLTGTVTIDLYKGGVYQKTLGTPDATAGTFSWMIAADETAGTDYTICAWQSGGVSDDSDAAFAIVRVVRVDFNRDGLEDLLWRYYGEGGYNRVWFLGSTEEAGQPLSLVAASPQSAATRTLAMKTGIADPHDIGIVSGRIQKLLPREAEALMGFKDAQAQAIVSDPRNVAKLNSATSIVTSPAGISDPRSVGSSTSMAMAADPIASATVLKTWLGGADVMPVSDLNWQIAGIGDFNKDSHVDILWRNISNGTNVVWFMNGTEWSASAELIPVADQKWQIVGTGDFDNDTHVDILWRNSSDGSNVVWYMDGATWKSSAVLLGVSDPNWQIVGTGDFNKDGNVDLLWRYNGAGGSNVVWYMDGVTWIGSAELIPVGDTAWQIMGTGDYNNDGNVDILWRYNGAGGYNYIWYMDQVTWIGGGDLLPVTDLTWRIVNR